MSQLAFIQARNGTPAPAPAPVGHNSDAAHRATGQELHAFINRFEQLQSEKDEIAGLQKEVMAEAKARGYDTKVLRKIIAERKRDPGELAEEQAIMELYREAMEMT